jgi:hypothetical protein
VLNSSGLPPAPYTVQHLPAPDQSAHNEVRAMKLQLEALLAERVAYYTDAKTHINGAESLPADFNDWPTAWERHGWTPTIRL